jgi:DNA-binding beta-propeller fold protein YncE
VLVISLLALISLTALACPAVAQDLGGGVAASHGRVPRFVLDRWLPNNASTLAFVDAPTAMPAGAGILSAGRTALSLPFLPGTLIADPTLGVVLAMGASITLGLPTQLNGRTLYIQGVLLDGASLRLTDATQVNVWRPLAVVGCQRQTANSLLVIDVMSRVQVDRIGNSENGSIAISADRRLMYVCEPGSVRNRVAVFDISTQPAMFVTNITNTGGVRYRGEFSPDGRILYVPVHDGVDVIDTDRNSATYHTVLRKIPTPITGSSTTIFTGPIDVAVTPDGTKLFIAYGESGAVFPGRGTLGVIDLTLPTFPHRSIRITLSGVVNLLGNLATHNAVRVSPDGQFVYLLEFGFRPGAMVQGFTNGSSVKVVDAVNEVEVAAIATNGIGQGEINLDLLGRNLWLAQVDLNGNGELLRFDVDRRSATRNTLRTRIPIGAGTYASGAGPSGAMPTADGALVLVTVTEDGTHPTPELVTVDAATNTVVGTPITVESLPRTVSVQR